METKGILRMVLRVLGMVFVVILSLGSICDNENDPVDPDEPVEPVLTGVEGAAIKVWCTSQEKPPYTFGEVQGGKSKTLAFGIANVGTASLGFFVGVSGKDVNVGAGPHVFSWDAGSCGVGSLPPPKKYGSAEPESSCYLTITFQPEVCENATHAAKLTVWSNDPDHPEISHVITGYSVYDITCWPGYGPSPDTAPDTGTGTGTRSGK